MCLPRSNCAILRVVKPVGELYLEGAAYRWVLWESGAESPTSSTVIGSASAEFELLFS